MTKMPALLRKRRRLSEVAPVLGSAAIFTISRESGLIWMTANAQKQFHSWRAGRRLKAGGKDCVPFNRPAHRDPPEPPAVAAKVIRTKVLRIGAATLSRRLRAWRNRWAKA